MDRRKLLKTCGFGLAAWLGIGLWRTFPLPPRPRLLEGAGVIHLMDAEYSLLDRQYATLAVIGSGILLLRNEDIEFYERKDTSRWDGSFERVLPAENLSKVQSFAFDPGGNLLFIADDALSQVTPDGKTEKLAELNHFHLSLAPGYEAGSVLLFGGHPMRDGGVLLRATGGTGTATVEGLAVFDGRARAALDASDGTYVALDSKIYQVIGSNQRLVFELSGALAQHTQAGLGAPERLVSLAMSDDEKILFFSTQDSIYALNGALAVPVARELGGILQFRDGTLFVLDPNRQVLLGITDVVEALRKLV